VFDTIGIIGRRGDDRAAASLADLTAFLTERSHRVLLDAKSTASVDDAAFEKVSRKAMGEACDLVIVLAGDGTLLGAARSLADYGVPLVGVNLGRLGFLTDISPAEMAERLDEILNGEFDEDQRHLLSATVTSDNGQSSAPLLALNEVVAHKLNIARLIEMETFVDGRMMSRQRCDGMVVATPTGSTAYALSGGGPIVHPSVDAMVVVHISPHTLTSRPVVVSLDTEVEIVVQSAREGEVRITCDGQVGRELAPGEILRVKRYPKPLRLIHPKGHDYFATVRAKLYWGRES